MNYNLRFLTGVFTDAFAECYRDLRSCLARWRRG